MNEKKLIESLKKGDERAFDAIFKKYASDLYCFSLDMLKNAEEAEEIVQDTFLVVWENRRVIDPERSFRSYLNSIAKHKIFNVFRRRLTAQKFRLSGERPETESANVESELQFEDLRDLLHNSISRLAPYQKEILVMRTQGLTNEEIAAVMNISKRTVEYHLSKAYKQLRLDLSFLKDSYALLLPLITILM